MAFKATLLLLVWTALALPGLRSSYAETLIAGTDASPPTYSPSFFVLLSHYDVATPFTVPADGPYRVTRLQVPLYHYPDIAGSSALFSIYEDVAGAPGTALVDFLTHDIGTTEQVMDLTPNHPQLLLSGRRYWLAGGTLGEQVNWNIPDNVFGQIATRDRTTGHWFVDPVPNGNIPAFAVLGTRVPEAGSAILLIVGLSSAIGGRLARKRLAAEHKTRV